jgi:long-chain acyl-CoA synthetase
MYSTPAEEIELIEENRFQIEKRSPLPTLSALLSDQARAIGERVCIQSIEGRRCVYTYREFDRLVNRTASALSGVGVCRGSHVAVAVPNGVVIAAVWIALARIGAVAVAVNIALTLAELLEILASSDSQFLVVDQSRLDWILHWRSDVVSPERLIVVGGPERPLVGRGFEALLAEASDRFEPATVDPDEPASILFTSGSSGRPKPALLPHRWHTMMGLVRSLQGPPVSSVLIENPMYYMGGQWRLAMALTQGASAVVATKPTIQNFLERVSEYNIEFASISNLFGGRANCQDRSRNPLKWLASSGLPKDTHARLEAKLNAPIREIYGSTETGSTIVMPTLAGSMVGSGSCGRPAAWRACRIVGEDGNTVESGDSGELEVKGPGVLLGYYKMPEETTHSFRDGWFRTGDRFRQDCNGYYYWMARIKDVIRRSNENISAAEVEEVILRLSEIAEACALPVPDDYRGEEVKVYLRLVEGVGPLDITPNAILEHCRNHLAPFKLPRYMEYVEDFPRTVSLKVSKQALKEGRRDLRAGSFDLVDQVWR